MKKLIFTVSLACTLFMYSCIGSFGLTRKIYNWNQSMGDKWINEVVFFVLSFDVYAISVFADAVLFNTIEFWTGNNPVASNTTVIDTENGKYIVESNENGYTISNGEETVQLFNENDVWFAAQGDNVVELFKYVDNDHVCLNLGDRFEVVELSQEGVDNLRAELGR